MEQKEIRKTRVIPTGQHAVVSNVMDILMEKLPTPPYQIGRDELLSGLAVKVVCDDVLYWISPAELFASLDMSAVEYPCIGICWKPHTPNYNKDIVRSLLDAGYNVYVDGKNYAQRMI